MKGDFTRLTFDPAKHYVAVRAQQGRVSVDGHVVTELGVRILATQTVHVDGVRVQLDESRVYLAFTKPIGVVTSMSDELGRVDIGDFVGNRKERLFHVGRLDADTEGLLILTNDGELAHRLQHPQYGVLKTYLAQIRGPVPRDMGKQLREGVQLEDGPASVDSFRVVDSQPGKALVEVILHEGRKHIVRRLLDAVGHPVLSLVRVQVGGRGVQHGAVGILQLRSPTVDNRNQAAGVVGKGVVVEQVAQREVGGVEVVVEVGGGKGHGRRN